VLIGTFFRDIFFIYRLEQNGINNSQDLNDFTDAVTRPYTRDRNAPFVSLVLTYNILYFFITIYW
jgi:hypothetical protein